MIKGQVFANQLFENQIFALFINTFTDGKDGVSDNYKNGMAITYSGSDVTIDSGAVLIQGRFLEEDTSTTISAGADNMYCKLVIEIDLDKTNTTTEFNQGYYKIVKSSTTWPTLTQTNIVKNVSGIYQYELARFRTTANGITGFEDRRTFIDFASIYDEIRQHIQDIDDGSLWVQKSGDTMTGTLVAEGGVTGNLTGNASTSTTASSCSGNSATATKLQTARTINGTSFNGTANITTSKWGTARTLALTGDITGSASIDGSSNVSITTSVPAITTGTDITIPATYGNGNFVLLFRKRGHVVQMEALGHFTRSSETSLLVQNLTITIPDWAKPSYINSSRLTPLLVGEFHGQGIDENLGSHIEIYKNTSGTYKANLHLPRNNTEKNDMYFVGTYIV